MLIIAILAVTDRRNCPPPTGLIPVAIFLTLLGIGLALGMETGYALNPARDLGPRILTAMVGYGKAGMHITLHVNSVSHFPQFLTLGINTGFGARYSARFWVCKPELWSTTPSSTLVLTALSTSRTY